MRYVLLCHDRDGPSAQGVVDEAHPIVRRTGHRDEEVTRVHPTRIVLHARDELRRRPADLSSYTGFLELPERHAVSGLKGHAASATLRR